MGKSGSLGRDVGLHAAAVFSSAAKSAAAAASSKAVAAVERLWPANSALSLAKM